MNKFNVLKIKISKKIYKNCGKNNFSPLNLRPFNILWENFMNTELLLGSEEELKSLLM